MPQSHDYKADQAGKGMIGFYHEQTLTLQTTETFRRLRTL
ncbi:hypothetical protein JOC55_006042 [Paenibacillus sacheonensis]|nr:hypothetical protein [Paenibacillus sacheonensis]